MNSLDVVRVIDANTTTMAFQPLDSMALVMAIRTIAR